MRTPTRISALVATGVLVAAGAWIAVERFTDSGAGTTGMPPVPAGLERFYSQNPQWGSCEGMIDTNDRVPPNAECTRITVPLDYAHPDGRTVQVALSRIRASGPKRESLLINPGGPGMSGLSSVVVAANTPLAQHFDRVAFDPRGIGASTPAISCYTPAEADAERAEPPKADDPAGIAAQEAEERHYADSCAQRTGTDVLSHIGTREVASDMDVIRAVLGEARLNYLGYSYGTRLGSAYAEKFPHNVRTMVLDGAIDPEQDPLAETVGQAAGFQKAFDAYAAQCAKAPDCPLGTDTSQAVRLFRSLVDPLREQAAHTRDPRGLSYDDAITGVQQTLYTESFWQVLTVGLTELHNGQGDTLLRLADMYRGRRDDGSYTNVTDAFNAIRCVDDPPVTDRGAVGRQDSEYRRAAPFLDDGRSTGAAPLDTCAFWPVPNTDGPHRLSAPGLPQVLVVSTTGDPATPYQAGVDLAQQLGGVLLTNDGQGHTVVFNAGVTCIDDAVTDYFQHTTLPAPGTHCR